MRRTSRIVWLGAGVFVLAFLTLCVGLLWPLELVAYLVAGWALFIARVGPQVSVDWGTVLLSGGLLAVFAVGLHGMLRWFFGSVRHVRPAAATHEPSIDGAGEGGWRWQWTLAIVVVVVMLFVAGTSMVGITHQVVWWVTSPEPTFDWSSSVRDAAQRNSSLYNLRQMGLGLLTHVETSGVLPAGGTMNAQGELAHGWQAHLLPFIEEQQLYDQIDFTHSWKDERNSGPYKTPVEKYTLGWFRRNGRATSTEDGYPLSDYAANVHAIGGTRQRSLDELRGGDGAAKTILAGEIVSDRNAWGYPANWRDPTLGLNTSSRGFGSPWKGRGVQFVFADGSVRLIDEDIDPEVLRAMSVPAAGPHGRGVDGKGRAGDRNLE